ncbi:MAG: glycosyltransferase family 61 protein [Elusimicrobiota bacterium]|nr:glycosyltransferase family 61 protein [Elusimicrobiota bacterium]
MKVYGDEDLQAQAKDWYNTFQNQTFQLKSQTYNNAVVFPYKYTPPLNCGGVFDENNNLIELSKDLLVGDIPVGYPQRLEKTCSYKTINKDVVYLGYCSLHFGHFLISSLSRFWFLLESTDKTKDLVYISDKDNLFISDILNFVGWEGGARKVYRIEEPIKFKSVTIPQPCYIENQIKYKEIYRKIGEKVKAYKNYKKIFLSRAKFKGSYKIYGEEHFEKAFKKAGFKIICPEKLSLKKQIGLMKNCEHLAGISGSALHLSLFCKDGIELSDILRYRTHFVYQLWINTMKNITDNYIAAYSEPLTVVANANYPRIVNINDKNFIDYANDNKMDIKKRPEYCLTPKEFLQFISDWSLAAHRDVAETLVDTADIGSAQKFSNTIKSIVNVEDLRRQTRPLRNLVFRIFKAKILFLTNFIPSKNKRKILRNQALNWIHLKLFYIKYY